MRGVLNAKDTQKALATGDPKFLNVLLNAYDPEDTFKKALKSGGVHAAVAEIAKLNERWLENELATVSAASLAFKEVAERVLRDKMLN